MLTRYRGPRFALPKIIRFYSKSVDCNVYRYIIRLRRGITYVIRSRRFLINKNNKPIFILNNPQYPIRILQINLRFNARQSNLAFYVYIFFRFIKKLISTLRKTSGNKFMNCFKTVGHMAQQDRQFNSLLVFQQLVAAVYLCSWSKYCRIITLKVGLTRIVPEVL